MGQHGLGFDIVTNNPQISVALQRNRFTVLATCLTGVLLIVIAHTAGVSSLTQALMTMMAPAPPYFLAHFIGPGKNLANQIGRYKLNSPNGLRNFNPTTCVPRRKNT